MSNTAHTNNSDNSTTENSSIDSKLRNGAFSFALLFFTAILFLVLNIDDQTRWVSGKSLTSQPRFWPAVTLGLTLFFSVIYLLSTLVSRPKFDGGREWLEWLRALEFAGWFAGYSALVPVAGYLLATLLICGLLALRLGYRSTRQIATALLSGLVIVLFFRVLLGIHIPGGALYEKLPQPLSNFMMNWF